MTINKENEFIKNTKEIREIAVNENVDVGVALDMYYAKHDIKYAPSWDDMCKLKDMFYKDEDEVWQCHPKKSEYVNFMENCLHLLEGKLVTE